VTACLAAWLLRMESMALFQTTKDLICWVLFKQIHKGDL
jgi:hypothetical protein